MVSTAEVIAILEICVYIPIFILTAILVVRHGFQRQLGWIYLAIFCVVRLAGAGFKIASVHNPTNSTDLEWSAILQSVGLSPLIMASLGLLKRITDEVSQHVRSGDSYALNNVMASSGIAKRLRKVVFKHGSATSRRSRIIQIAALPTMIALILCIVGGIDASNSDPSDVSSSKSELKAGIAIFLVIYILLFGLVVITMKDFGNAPHGEKRIFFAVIIALPFLAVRLLWSILSVFGNNPDFSVVSGKPLIQLFMATLEEFVIVVCYTLAGLTAA